MDGMHTMTLSGTLSKSLGGLLGSKIGDLGDVINVFRDDSPSAGLINLTGTEAWNSKQEGFMWIRVTPTNLAGVTGDQFLMDLDDGDSNPAAGMRIREGNDDTFSNRYRDDTVDLSSQRLNRNPAIQDTVKTMGFSWSNAEGKIRIISGGLYEEGTFTAGSGSFPSGSSGFSRLYIGSRNGNSDPFTGTYDVYEIGDRFLTFAQLSSRMRHANLLTIVGGGQSLMDDHFDSTQTNGSPGFNQFVLLGDSLYGDEVWAVNGSTGSSGLSNLSNPTDYWWHRTNQEPGPSYDTWLNEIQIQGLTPSWCFWAQGEEDSGDIDNVSEITRAQYKADLLALFQRMRSDVNSNMNIGIQGLGRRNGGYTNTGGIQTIREVQQEVAAENSFVYVLGYSYDTDLQDTVHLVDAGYTTVAQRLMRRAAQVDGQTVTGSTVGPQITAANRSGTSVTVTISHDAGTDFTPATGIVGFRFFDDAAEITVNSAVRTNATTVTLTLASTPTGVETLYYCYDDATDITNANNANVLKDNSAQTMPLVPANIVL